jgi:UDP-N-acetylmuramoylalanine--D-glutamate ligase
MIGLENKHVLVIGLGMSGRAACQLLRRAGARVTAVDRADTEALRREAQGLGTLGVRVHLGVDQPPDQRFDLVVVSPGVPATNQVWRRMNEQSVPVIGELELGYQRSHCLHLAITGTNGKTTTTELVERLLTHAHRRAVAAGNIGRPLCAVVDETRDLDFVVLEVSSFQMETIRYFRPVVAVLLNLTPDHLDRYANLADYIRAKARVFLNQQPFDWAIVQTDALAQMRSLNLGIPAKTVTFSATDQQADLYLDRGLLLSRLPGWSGVLLEMDSCKLRGPHNAENLLAALAVGHVLRVPLEQMVPALVTYEPAKHRCEFVAEIGGVKYINDSKATNVDAVRKALLTVSPAGSSQRNVWLIAGGKDKRLDYDDLGPVLCHRVKGVLLIGETARKMRTAWSPFTTCALANSLLEAVTEAAGLAAPGDVVLLSPGSSSFDMFQDYQHRGEVFRQAVRGLVHTTGGMVSEAGPTPRGAPGAAAATSQSSKQDFGFASKFSAGKTLAQPTTSTPKPQIAVPIPAQEL